MSIHYLVSEFSSIHSVLRVSYVKQSGEVFQLQIPHMDPKPGFRYEYAQNKIRYQTHLLNSVLKTRDHDRREPLPRQRWRHLGITSEYSEAAGTSRLIVIIFHRVDKEMPSIDANENS